MSVSLPQLPDLPFPGPEVSPRDFLLQSVLSYLGRRDLIANRNKAGRSFLGHLQIGSLLLSVCSVHKLSLTVTEAVKLFTTPGPEN